MATLLPGITARTVATPRLAVNILEREEPGSGPVVVFLHGNVSSSLFWQPLMLDLPDTVRPIAIDLRGFGDSETAPVDATRGLSDSSDGVLGVLDVLGIERAHFVGWSMGAGVVLQVMLDRADVVASATLTARLTVRIRRNDSRRHDPLGCRRHRRGSTTIRATRRPATRGPVSARATPVSSTR
jgi:pimeloyl-ACP methyl ester carboxylesterase